MGAAESERPTATAGPREIDPSGIPRLGRLPWAVLLKRVFLADVLECPKCTGRMKILAVVTKSASVRSILNHLGLSSEAPRLRPARSPPQPELGEGGPRSDDYYADPPGREL